MNIRMKWMLSFGLLLAIVIPLTGVNANEEGVVIFHYQRHNEDYDDWGLWMWAGEQGGVAYEFEGGQELGAAVTIDLNDFDLGTESELGFIVRKGEWETKDVDQDRFVDLSRMVNGELHVYLVEGDATIYDDADIDFSPHIVLSTFESFTEISVLLSVVTEDVKGISVRSETNGEVAIKEVIPEDKTAFRVVLDEEINLEEVYFIMMDGFKDEIQISLSGMFDSDEFHEAFYYDGDDLGFNYSPEATMFRLWAPTASDVVLNLYEEGSGDNLIKAIPALRDEKGTWVVTVEQDLNFTYYTYDVTVDGRTQEAVDPYARAVGVNGLRGMVIDLTQTNPENWRVKNRPEFSGNPTDAVIYELHMRDWSSHQSSEIEHVGKYLQFTEPGATDHLNQLGITHLHLLPVYNFMSIDETRLDEPQFNWGYDPLNYNAPEGSYSTDPTRGEVRINEFKQMVNALHENDIRVVMDVVYNHTGPTVDSDFNKIVPGYYYRQDEYGNFSNGSGCGNETASDRLMMRRFIVDSVVYWATEYHIDGFRFDLMALHDSETMNQVRAALDLIDPSIIVYGEGWDAGGSALDPELAASKVNAASVPGIAMFNDDLRDGVRGSVFVEDEAGFVNGDFSYASRVKFGVVGAVMHPQIDYNLVAQAGGVSEPWALEAAQSVNYVSAHDNHTLFDKLRLTLPDADLETIKAMQKQSNAIVLTAQGVPFLHAGVEMMRTKEFDHNSYQSPDEINQLNWNWLDEHHDVFDYYQGLITLRREHPAFRMSDQSDIAEHLTFLENVSEGVVAFHLNNYANGDSISDIIVIHNVNPEKQKIALPLSSTWNVVVDNKAAGVETLSVVEGDEVTVNAHSTFVLMADAAHELNEVEAVERSVSAGLVARAVAFVSALAVAGYVLKKRKTNNKL